MLMKCILKTYWSGVQYELGTVLSAPEVSCAGGMLFLLRRCRKQGRFCCGTVPRAMVRSVHVPDRKEAAGGVRGTAGVRGWDNQKFWQLFVTCTTGCYVWACWHRVLNPLVNPRTLTIVSGGRGGS